jgi:hypothetical protein
LGFNVGRSFMTGYDLNNRLNELHKGTFAPPQPTTLDYVPSGLRAEADEKYINSIPARQWGTYLKEKDKNNGIVFRLPPSKPSGANVSKNAIPAGNKLKGAPVYKTPMGYVVGREGEYEFPPPLEQIRLQQGVEFMKNFSGALKEKYSDAFEKAKNTVSSTPNNGIPKPDYDALKTRTMYPSFGSK